MRTLIQLSCMIVALTVGSVTTSTAQASRRGGLWGSFGLGGGWNGADVGNTRNRGAAGYFRIGGTVNRHVLLGFEAVTWWRETQSGFDQQRVNATAAALVYPFPSSGLFVKGGFGVATEEFGGVNKMSGVGATFGLGIDLPISRKFSITPNVDLLTQFYELDTATSLVFTLGLLWH